VIVVSAVTVGTASAFPPHPDNNANVSSQTRARLSGELNFILRKPFVIIFFNAKFQLNISRKRPLAHRQLHFF